MPSSSLDPDTILENDRQLGIGHGLDALGPSDNSDTGSDAMGAYASADADTSRDIGFDRTITSDQPYDPVLGLDAIEHIGEELDDDVALSLAPLSLAPLSLEPTTALDEVAEGEQDTEGDESP